jgi:type IV pilus assembly protein PilB
MSSNRIKGVLRDFLKSKGVSDADIVEYFGKITNGEYFKFFFEGGLISDLEFAQYMKSFVQNEFVDISSVSDSEFPIIDEIPNEMFIKHTFIPFILERKKLTIITNNPMDFSLKSDLKNLVKRDVVVLFSNHISVKDKLTRDVDNGMDMDDFDESELDLIDPEEDEKDSLDLSAEIDSPMIKYVDKILSDSVKMGASDIHFEPYEKSYRVRFRIDGVLREVSKPKANMKRYISARLKVMSKIDTAEKRIPQDGRIKMVLGRKPIDFRVSTLPTLYGEKIVLRLLDASSAKMGIDNLGYEPHQKELFLKALVKPQGMILVTGPTGSGKTVSLYTGLNILNEPDVNIATAEDPVEINLEGINQVQINKRAGLDFGSALRAFLRQDPDIIMVGEIRDLETAEIAIKAAQTGHMVMSTLHTNSASETIVRLKNMGVPSYNVATSVNLIIAQRLARRLCPHCKVKTDFPDSALLELGYTKEDLLKDSFGVFEPFSDGCDKCSSGYKGRLGIYEVVEISKTLSKLILNNATNVEINEQLRAEGYEDLRRSALVKASEGHTSLAEVNRVTTD